MACKGGTMRCGNDKYFPNAYYEIGDLYLTTRNDNPSLRYGGTWELYGKGKTLVCVDTTDTDFNTVGKTGGEKKHTLTTNEMPKHEHGVNQWNQTDSGNLGRWAVPMTWKSSCKGEEKTYWTGQTGNVGDSQSHNNLQPYITCYIWRRIG